MYILKGKNFVKSMGKFQMEKFLKVANKEYLNSLEIYNLDDEIENMRTLSKHLGNIRRVA